MGGLKRTQPLTLDLLVRIGRGAQSSGKTGSIVMSGQPNKNSDEAQISRGPFALLPQTGRQRCALNWNLGDTMRVNWFELDQRRPPYCRDRAFFMFAVLLNFLHVLKGLDFYPVH